MRERGGGWGRNEREREWEREREREMERGWAQREWERERERGRLERERARERERRETSTFGTFGYGRPIPLRSDRDSVFLESDQVPDTTPLLPPQPSPSAAPRMGTAAVGRNRAGSKVGPESGGGGMVSKFDNGSVGLVLVDSRSGCGPRLISEVGIGNMSEAEIRAGIQEHHRVESWNKYDNGSRASIKNGSETRMGSEVKTQQGGRDLEGKVQSGIRIENMAPVVNKEGHRGGTRSGEKHVRGVAQAEPYSETIPSTVTNNENRIEPEDKVEIGDEPGSGMKPEIKAEVEAKANSKPVENRTGIDTGGEATVSNEVGSGAESRVEAQVETEVKLAPTAKPKEVFDAVVSKETETKSNTETGVVIETQNSNKATNKDQMSTVAGGKNYTVPADQVEKKPLDVDQIKSSHVERGSKSHKSKSSKSSSRSRPGTATGLRPGVLSPRLSRGFGDLESTGPPESIESTWPRRIMVRKRTVRQGGALHNLPILPPLPSVLSALEKRRPHAHLLPRLGHFSENPLSCSLKEPSHPDLGLGASGVGRASLKEQKLEHWRVCREQEESMRSRSKDKQREQSKEKTEIEERTGKEEKQDRDSREEKVKEEEKLDKEKVVVTISEKLAEETKREKSERRVEVKVQEYVNIKEDVKKARDIEIIGGKEVRGITTKDGIQERQVQELEKKLVAKSKKEESQAEEEEGGTFGEEEGIEGWDTVLDMVDTLWEDGWEKGGEVGVGDTDSFSGSLQRWPLLRPPIGFGGSHPPSSAASELSLTELERRARELDSDLEHLDLSKPHRDTQNVYQSLLEPQRADMYQTHPGPQREKAVVSTGKQLIVLLLPILFSVRITH